MIADTAKIPPSGKHRSESNNRKQGKKKKQISRDIRAAQELNASGGYFQKMPTHNVRQVYKAVGQQSTPSGAGANDIFIQHGFEKNINKSGHFSGQKVVSSKFASDQVLQDQIVSKTLNHNPEGQSISRYLSEYQNLKQN